MHYYNNYSKSTIMDTRIILTKYPRILREPIHRVSKSKFGILLDDIKMRVPQHKLVDDFDMNTGNSLILEIPYAGKYLELEFVFNDDNLQFPPDLNVLNDTFLSDVDVDFFAKNTTLNNWNIRNPNSLVQLINELLSAYKQYQLEKLESDPILQNCFKEYEELVKEMDLNNGDVEVFIDNTAQHFIIPIKLDFSNLPIYIDKSYFTMDVLKNPQNNSVILKLIHYSQKTQSLLFLSPSIEALFGYNNNLHLPPYKRENTMLEYTQLIVKLVEDKMNKIKVKYESRKKYIEILLSLHGSKVLNYDTFEFKKATFLFNIDTFYFIVHILLNDQFPIEKPLVTMRSIYHIDETNELTVENYPYNSKWTTEFMVNKLLTHLCNNAKYACDNNA